MGRKADKLSLKLNVSQKRSLKKRKKYMDDLKK